MSVPTVKTHVGRIFDKLQVRNRVEIAICLHDANVNPDAPGPGSIG
jgi:DNA-binding NarL/FixJ family response regulator